MAIPRPPIGNGASSTMPSTKETTSKTIIKLNNCPVQDNSAKHSRHETITISCCCSSSCSKPSLTKKKIIETDQEKPAQQHKWLHDENGCSTTGTRSRQSDRTTIIIPFIPKKAMKKPPAGYVWRLLTQSLGGTTGVVNTFVPPALVYYITVHKFKIDIFPVFMTVFCTFFASFIYTNTILWKYHQNPNEKGLQKAQDFGSTPFMNRADMVEIHDHDEIPDVKVWKPQIKLEHFHRHGVCTLGLSYFACIRDLFTYALEFKIQSFFCVLAVELGFGRFNPAKNVFTAHNNYQFIVNTNLCCYSSKSNPSQVVMYHTKLFHNHNEPRLWYKITIELDHEKQICVRMLLQEHKEATIVPETDLHGNKILHFHQENLAVKEASISTTSRPNKAILVYVIEDQTEIGNICSKLAATKSHVVVHFLSNGIADLQKNEWALAKEASDMVQSLNYSAIHSSGAAFTDMTPKNLADTLGYNIITEGLPIHNYLAQSSFATMRKNSKFHRMTSQARHRLFKEFPHISRAKIEVLIATTIMHSADHYYYGTLIGFDGRIEFLGSDFTVFRATVCGSKRYLTRKLLCCQHLDDPICKILYECAISVDADFAKHGLFMTVAT